MPDEKDWTNEQDQRLRDIEAARNRMNKELDESWKIGTPQQRAEYAKREQAARARLNEMVRSGVTEQWNQSLSSDPLGRHHGGGDGRDERDRELLLKVLARLADVLDKLVLYLEQHAGGTKLFFKLLFQGGNMATVNILSIQRLSGVVGVLTDAPHGLTTGGSAVIAGVSDPTFNGTASNVTVTGPTNFTFAQAGLPDTAAPLVGGTVASATGGGGTGSGTGVVGTPSTFAVTVVDQNGATQPLPSGVTPQVAVTGGSGATGSISSDNSTVTVNYTAAGTYTVTVSDPSGQVQSGSATVTVTGGTTGGTLTFVLTQTS